MGTTPLRKSSSSTVPSPEVDDDADGKNEAGEENENFNVCREILDMVDLHSYGVIHDDRNREKRLISLEYYAKQLGTLPNFGRVYNRLQLAMLVQAINNYNGNSEELSLYQTIELRLCQNIDNTRNSLIRKDADVYLIPPKIKGYRDKNNDSSDEESVANPDENNTSSDHESVSTQEVSLWAKEFKNDECDKELAKNECFQEQYLSLLHQFQLQKYLFALRDLIHNYSMDNKKRHENDNENIDETSSVSWHKQHHYINHVTSILPFKQENTNETTTYFSIFQNNSNGDMHHKQLQWTLKPISQLIPIFQNISPFSSHTLQKEATQLICQWEQLVLTPPVLLQLGYYTRIPPPTTALTQSTTQKNHAMNSDTDTTQKFDCQNQPSSSSHSPPKKQRKQARHDITSQSSFDSSSVQLSTSEDSFEEFGSSPSHSSTCHCHYSHHHPNGKKVHKTRSFQTSKRSRTHHHRDSCPKKLQYHNAKMLQKRKQQRHYGNLALGQTACAYPSRQEKRKTRSHNKTCANSATDASHDNRQRLTNLRVARTDLKNYVNDPLQDSINAASTAIATTATHAIALPRPTSPSHSEQIVSKKRSKYALRSNDQRKTTQMRFDSDLEQDTPPSGQLIHLSELPKSPPKIHFKREPVPRRFFTDAEKAAIKSGVERFGVGHWAKIRMEYFDFLGERTSVQIKDCYRTMSRRGEI